MKYTSIFFSGAVVWFLQLIFSDLLAISTVRPDFCLILILYWSFQYSRFIVIILGFLMGLFVDLSGSALFFGLSPLTYTITCYLSGSVNQRNFKLNTFYFSICWIMIILLQFFVYCFVQYQELWELNTKLFIINWIGTSFYTISFIGILQTIFPLHRLYNVKS
tara:strand:- start:36 stop:524 length:489 start_codon:yes stop_codon:yes gene_type:complete